MAASPKTTLVLLCSAAITRLPGQAPNGTPGSRANSRAPAVRCSAMPASRQLTSSGSCRAS